MSDALSQALAGQVVASAVQVATPTVNVAGTLITGLNVKLTDSAAELILSRPKRNNVICRVQNQR